MKVLLRSCQSANQHAALQRVLNVLNLRFVDEFETTSVRQVHILFQGIFKLSLFISCNDASFLEMYVFQGEDDGGRRFSFLR